MSKYLIFFTLIFSLNLWALNEPTSTQADNCIDCINAINTHALPKQNLDNLNELLKNIKPKCGTDKGIINSSRESVVNKWIPKSSDINLDENIIRLSMSCIYGLGEGALTSIISLVETIEAIVDMAAKSGMGLIEYIKNNKLQLFFENLNLKDLAHSVNVATHNEISEVMDNIKNINKNISEKYKSLGVQGAMSAISYEFWQKSPHHVIKKYLSKSITSVHELLNREIKNFNCLENEAKSELICKVISSIGANIAIGVGVAKGYQLSKNLIKGNLSKVANGILPAAEELKVARSAEVIQNSKEAKSLVSLR